MSRPSKKKLSEEEYLRKKYELLLEQKRIEDGLPHLYSFKWYRWARRVFEARDKEIFLVAANQLSKSSTAIRKNIHWATSPDLWPELWPGLLRSNKPNLFWYFYPNLATATTEFETKWADQFLPRNEYKNHPVYGWKDEWEKGYIHSIKFNTGVQIQFKTYTMKVKDIQASSVYMITCDEEMPVDFLAEIKSRLNATDGYLLHVFTATLGQMHWQMAMEPPTKAEEKHPDALKLQVSLYDSQEYEDGSPSPWTDEKIKRAIANCPTDAEIQRRIYGRFIKSEGLRFEAFNLEKNMTEGHPLPASWSVYASVDIGSGGQSGHPAAICFLAVSPDNKQGRVFRAWRGDGIPTTAADILEKYRELRGKLPVLRQIYDWGSKDFFNYATRIGEAFEPADKKQDAGVGLLNTLFKSGILKLHRGDPEIGKLVQELMSLPVEIDKRNAKDDLCDALRYCVMAVPWDFSDVEISPSVQEDLKKEAAPIAVKSPQEIRREWFMGLNESKDESQDIGEEFDFWSDQLEGNNSEY